MFVNSRRLAERLAGALNELAGQEIARAHQQLDHIEHEVTSSKFPLDFTDRIYTLRQHVGFVRDSLARQKAP